SPTTCSTSRSSQRRSPWRPADEAPPLNSAPHACSSGVSRRRSRAPPGGSRRRRGTRVSTALHSDEYVLFCEGVRRLCQVDLLQYKRNQMERRIRSFAARRGIARLAEYLSLLGSHSDELEEFLDRVTINVSQLWRNPEQWRLLAGDAL